MLSTGLVACMEMQMDFLAYTAETRLSESEEETARVYLTQESLLSRIKIQLELKQHPVLSRVANWLKAGERPPRKDVERGGRELLSYWSEWSRLVLKDDLVWRRWEDEVSGNELYQQLCLPRKLVAKVLKELHDTPTSGHMGISRTVKRARERFYWHGLRDDVENHIKA